ncbi:MAG: repressor LexA [Candidatus Vogelbacteria bacterium CG10_big_fil_rev_8_21_14_0_10_51_16]|uniref:Repressor LexA n=1 Tax=Candidatus Vogelbacteria bacterium CG10_big_fil_rev_8_21_14_0_10_51_16 TaxID=1975045 RepID=A0A2H0RFC4_9BACT|nr:MAG: repressor LexA [Candidatus Vogelbacteria bacterium CG10_big_fil_rev_8_21_14_0_10_51_16]
MPRTKKEYWSEILRFYRSRRRMPSYSEIMELCGFHSKNAVFRLVARLEAAGHIVKDPQGKLTPKNLYGGMKLLGSIEAGFPSPAEEQELDTISLDEYLIPRRDASFLLTVKGDSMIDAGIHEGDLVIVERGVTPKEGQIVIAEVDGEWTMKEYRKVRGKVQLVPANKKYKPIVPKEELKIEAVVRGVIRKY